MSETIGVRNAAVFWRLRRSLSRNRKNTASCICGWGLIIQWTMDAVMVVIESPAINHPASFLEAQYGDAMVESTDRNSVMIVWQL